jgi:hypothetical protein
VELELEAQLKSGIQQVPGLRQGESFLLAEDIEKGSQALLHYFGGGGFDELQVGFALVGQFRRHHVAAQVGCHDLLRSLVTEGAGDLQHFDFGIAIQAIAALDLDGSGAQFQGTMGPGSGVGKQILEGRGAGGADGVQDTAAFPQDLKVRFALHTGFPFTGAIAGEDQVGVAIDKAGQHHPTTGIDKLVIGQGIFRAQLGSRSNLQYSTVGNGYSTILDNANHALI